MNKDNLSKRLRDRIEASMERAEMERKKELFRRRVELARSGIVSYEQGKIKEAVKSFLTYLGILEEWKKVGPGQLTPAHFDLEKDIHEILLISGVYWDLAKIYDRSKNDAKVKDMHLYLNKFVTFSKGLSFQPVCAETMRRYIAAGKPVHRDTFIATYKEISKGKCFIATALLPDLNFNSYLILRRVRDETLLPTRLGTFFVKIYYSVGPSIAFILNRSPQKVREGISKILEAISRQFQSYLD